MPIETCAKCSLEEPDTSLQTTVVSAVQDVVAQEELVKDDRGDWSKPKPIISPKIVTEELPEDARIDAETEPTIGMM